MHYLEGAFDSAMEKISHYLVPDHQYKSIHDYFNPQLFHLALFAMFFFHRPRLPNIPSLAPHLDTLSSIAVIQQSQALGSNTSFTEARIKNFSAIWNVMQRALSYEGQQVREMSKQKLFHMVKDYDLDQLHFFLQHLFELLIKHHGAVQYITELPAEDQATIKDFLQRAKEKTDHHRIASAAKDEEEDEIRRLQDENNELRLIANSKDSDIQRLSVHIEQLQEQNQQLKELEALKQAEIDSLKKRLLAYEQADTLFQEKDQQIHKLQKAVASLQYSNQLLTSEISSEKNKLEAKITDLEQSNVSLQARFDKLTCSFQLLCRQKEQTQVANRKVITNLKEKIKSLTMRVSELQQQLVQSKISRELREKQFSQLWCNYQSLRSQSVNEGTGKGGMQLERVLSSGDLEKGIISSSGNHREFLRLGEEITELDKIQDNAFEDEIMMFESSEDNLKKVQEIISQNTRLKERLAALESKDTRGLMQQNDKLKKRLAVMRKRNEEIESQKRQELDLMVSAFQNCLRVRLEG